MLDALNNYNQTQAASIGAQSSAVTGPGVFRIDEAKAYVQNDRTIVEFTITPTDGRKTLRFVKLVIQNPDNTEGFGANIFNAMRGLLGLTDVHKLQIETVQEEVMNQMTDVNYLRGMENKVIGLLMQRYNWALTEDRLYYKYAMNIILPFDPRTKQTFSEKLNGQEAKSMERRAKNLKDKVQEGIGLPISYQKNAIADNPIESDTPLW